MNGLAEHPAGSPAATAPLRVFIADDSRIVHRYLTLSLGLIPGTELAGRAFNSRDAVAGVREVRPDVLILDVEMPPESGLEVLKTIRFDEPRPLIYVLTLHASPTLSSYCRGLGADRFFDKENDLATLLEILAQQAAQPAAQRRSAGAACGGFSEAAGDGDPGAPAHS
jgi:DNA-binding NarL/FixJ family response regulator